METIFFLTIFSKPQYKTQTACYITAFPISFPTLLSLNMGLFLWQFELWLRVCLSKFSALRKNWHVLKIKTNGIIVSFFQLLVYCHVFCFVFHSWTIIAYKICSMRANNWKLSIIFTKYIMLIAWKLTSTPISFFTPLYTLSLILYYLNCTN